MWQSNSTACQDSRGHGVDIDSNIDEGEKEGTKQCCECFRTLQFFEILLLTNHESYNILSVFTARRVCGQKCFTSERVWRKNPKSLQSKYICVKIATLQTFDTEKFT